MTDNQKLDLILEKVTSFDKEMRTLKEDTQEIIRQEIKKETQSLKQEMQDMKRETQELKKDVQELKQELKKETQFLKKETQALKKETQVLKKETQALKKETQALKADIKDVKLEITGINLTLENEIRVNIIRVAEGHLDLSRKLDEYIMLSHEIKDKQEINDVYINMHTNKLRALSS